MAQLVKLKGYKLRAQGLYQILCGLSERPTKCNTFASLTRKVARARLKKKGIIDFTHGKGNKPTEYRLIRLYPSDTTRDTPSDKPSDTERISYTAYAPKMFLDVKKIDDDDEARAGEQASGRVNAKAQTASGRESSGTAPNGNAPNADAIPLMPPTFDLNNIHDVWEFETGYQLTGSTAYELETLAKADFKLTHEAIVKAVQSKDIARLRYVYFRSVYDDLKKLTASKGGEKNDEQYEYAQPERSDNELERRLSEIKL